MFSLQNIYGTSLPKKTLCLTFDDGPSETIGNGPGPKTLKIAEYLNKHNIRATFFMVGKHIIQWPHILPEVARRGHIIGNHAFCHHLIFQQLLAKKWDFICEIEWTDNLIRDFNPNGTIYFRAPYGEFSSEVAKILNSNVNNDLNHIGPFGWDIDGGDWDYWENGKGSSECAQRYLDQIKTKDHGIVLMHDYTADLLKAKKNNLTFETIQILIPQLIDLGYKFIGIDEVPINSSTF